MIKITKFNGQEIVINIDLIEYIESTPDTVISTTTGKKIIVLESVDDIIDKVIKFKGKVIAFKNNN